MISLLTLGFLIGLRHALEADHVAAVAALVTRSPSLAHTLKQGAVWGLGHTLALFSCGSVVLLLGTAMPERFAQGLELAVGAMLVLLGADVLRRLRRERLHVHLHRHADGVRHVHAHCHDARERHEASRHGHSHRSRFPLRALLVGLTHGMAGSAALILLTLDQVGSPAQGLLYMALFGAGSMLGMAALSVVIAVPLRWSARGLTALHNGLQAVIGAVTVALGLALVVEVGFFGDFLNV